LLDSIHTFLQALGQFHLAAFLPSSLFIYSTKTYPFFVSFWPEFVSVLLNFKAGGGPRLRTVPPERHFLQYFCCGPFSSRCVCFLTLFSPGKFRFCFGRWPFFFFFLNSFLPSPAFFFIFFGAFPLFLIFIHGAFIHSLGGYMAHSSFLVFFSPIRFELFFPPRSQLLG